GLAATMVFVLTVRPTTPEYAVLVWCAAQVLVSPYSLWVNGRALGVGPFRPLRFGIPMLPITAAAVAVAMLVGGDGTFLALFQCLAVFATVVAVLGVPVLWLHRSGEHPSSGAGWIWRSVLGSRAKRSRCDASDPGRSLDSRRPTGSGDRR